MTHDDEFNTIIKDIIDNPYVLDMKNFRQHCDTSTFEHSYKVAYISYKICKKLNLDYKSVARAGMLHDFYLYDWRIKSSWHRWHAFKHGRFASINACKLFDLSNKEIDMIKKHMWPVTPIPPKSIEGFILTFADKYSASIESLDYYRKMLSKNQNYMYAKSLLWMFLFKLK